MSGLYDNIHKKRNRIAAGSGETMRKPGSPGAPTDAAFEQAAKTAKAMGGYTDRWAMARGGKAAERKYANGTTYKDSEGKTHKRVAHPGTKRGDAYCARSSGQKSKDGTKSAKLRARRKAWGCRGKKSVK